MTAFFRTLKSNLRRMFSGPRFLVGVAAGVLVLFMGVWDYIALPGRNVVELYVFSLQLGAFQALLACVPAIAYADSFIVDISCSAARFSVQRQSISHYLVGRYVSVVLSGFFTMVASCAVFCLLCGVWFPLDDYSANDLRKFVSGSYSEWIIQRRSILYLVAQALHQGLFGAFYAGFALMCSAYISNVYVVIAAPLVLLQWSGTIAHFLPVRHKLADMQFCYSSLASPSAAFLALAIKLVPYIIIAGILFYRRGKKKLYEIL